MTRVIALVDGHDGTFKRVAGEEFDLDLTDARYKGATWFAPKDKAPAPKDVDPNAQPPGAGPKKGSRVGDGIA